MFVRALAVLLVVSSETLAQQRPGIGTFGRGRASGKLTIDPGIEVTKPVNVINLMIENRAAVALSDSQFTRVISIKRHLDSSNAPSFRRIDSVQRLFKPGPVFTDPTVQRRDSVLAARALVREMIAGIEENIADARERAFVFLSASQASKAEELEEKARKAGATPPRGRL